MKYYSDVVQSKKGITREPREAIMVIYIIN